MVSRLVPGDYMSSHRKQPSSQIVLRWHEVVDSVNIQLRTADPTSAQSIATSEDSILCSKRVDDPALHNKDEDEKRNLENVQARLNMEQRTAQREELNAKGGRKPRGAVAKRWRDIQGAGDWQGLLDPMDPVLQEEIIKYGEFAQANYDAFDYENTSKYCGSSRFCKKKLLGKVGLGDSGYEVTRYIYAMSDILRITKVLHRSKEPDAWSLDSNWMGFVAVATNEDEITRLGRRDIIISWRGTGMPLEWVDDFTDYLIPTRSTDKFNAEEASSNVKVEKGFFSLYTCKDGTTRYNKNSAAEQVKEEIRRLVSLYADEELSITVTGHSLGAALAVLSAYDIAKSKLNERPENHKPRQGHDQLNKTPSVGKLSSPSATISEPLQEVDSEMTNPSSLGSIPVSVFSFAGPRVGNNAFRDRVEELGVSVLRVVNVHDIVPKVPGVFVNEKFYKLGALRNFVSPLLDRLPWTYSHVGVELKVDNKASPFLKATNDVDYSDFHDLEGYLHLVDGYHGKKLAFASATGRDHSLVNKSSGFLKASLSVPTSWWQAENKGLMRAIDGRWVQPDREKPEDIPSNNANDDWV